MEKELFSSIPSARDNTAIRIPAVAAIAFVLASTTLFGKISPFSAAFLSSLSGADCMASIAAAVAGFTLSGKLVEAIPTLCAMLGIGLFRLFIGRSSSTGVHIATAVLAAVSTFITSATDAQRTSDLLIAGAFAFMAGISSYCLTVLYKTAASKQGTILLKPVNAVALSIVAVSVIAALSTVEVSVINFGMVLSGIIILILTEKYGYFGAAIGGISVTFGIAVGNNEYVNGALIICVSGLAASVFMKYGKFTQSAAMILSAALAVVAMGANKITLDTMADVLMASALFAVLPTGLITSRIKKEKSVPEGIKTNEIFSRRLISAGDVIGEVSFAVEKTAEVLSRSNTRDISWVYNNACDKVCRECRFNMVCWGEEYDDNIKEMEILVSLLRKGENLISEQLPPSLRRRCNRREKLIDKVNNNYREFRSNEANSRRVNEMRGLLLTQLNVTENLLKSMGKRLSFESEIDKDKSKATEKLLTSLGLTDVTAAVVEIDERYAIEAFGNGKLTVGADKLGDSIIKLLKREFELPQIILEKNSTRITVYERASYGFSAEGCSFAKEHEKSCGDYYDSFADGRGNIYIMLSDGMGSGSRARIDSAFVCGLLGKMLKAGFDEENALEIINSSLYVKSDDESFATVDLCKVDLFTGNVKLYKAGAAGSYIKCGKKITRICGGGFPLGSSDKAQLETKEFTIGARDAVILVSDGADVDEDWLLRQTEKDIPLSETVQLIAASAHYRGQKGHGDDVSVMIFRLEK